MFAITSAFSWQNSIRLCPASFRIPRPNLPLAFQSPIMKRTSFLGVLKGLVGLHRTVQLLQRYWSGHRLGLPWYWMVCLGNEQRSFFVFEIASKYCISDSFVDYNGYSISSKGFLSTVVDKMVIWVKFTSNYFRIKVFYLLACLSFKNRPARSIELHCFFWSLLPRFLSMSITGGSCTDFPTIHQDQNTLKKNYFYWLIDLWLGWVFAAAWAFL